MRLGIINIIAELFWHSREYRFYNRIFVLTAITAITANYYITHYLGNEGAEALIHIVDSYLDGKSINAYYNLIGSPYTAWWKGLLICVVGFGALSIYGWLGPRTTSGGYVSGSSTSIHPETCFQNKTTSSLTGIP